MKKIPDWVKFAFVVVVAITGWVYSFASNQATNEVEFKELKIEVTEIKQELKKYNIAVLSNDLQHLSENVKANNVLLKEFNDFLRDLQKN